MSHQQPYAPPVIYGQVPPPYGQPQAPQYGHPAPYGAAPATGAGWLGGAPPAPAAPAHYQQQPYGGVPHNPLTPYQQPPPVAYQAPTTYQPAAPAVSGPKRALLVGCCYPGTSAALNGCINDVQVSIPWLRACAGPWCSAHTCGMHQL